MDEPRSWKPREVIDRHSAEDMRYWSQRFGVSDAGLRELISDLGPRVATIATHCSHVVKAEELRA